MPRRENSFGTILFLLLLLLLHEVWIKSYVWDQGLGAAGWVELGEGLSMEQGLLSTGLSKHLVLPYSDSGIRSTCHGDKSRPGAR